VTCSAITGENIPQIWQIVLEHRSHVEAAGHLAARRKRQALDWMHELISLGLNDMFRRSPAVSRRLPGITEAVERGELTPVAAARELLALLRTNE